MLLFSLLSFSRFRRRAAMSVRHFYSDGPHHARYGLRPTAAREWRVAGAQGSLQAEAQPRTAGSRVAAVHEYNPDSAEAPTARREGGAFSPLSGDYATDAPRALGRACVAVGAVGDSSSTLPQHGPRAAHPSVSQRTTARAELDGRPAPRRGAQRSPRGRAVAYAAAATLLSRALDHKR